MDNLKDFTNNIPEKNLDNEFGMVTKSSVKLIKNSRGLNFEIKVVSNEEHLMEGLKNEAVRVYRELEKEFEVKEKVGVEE